MVFQGLEIPNRRVVREGPYAWERHPAYMGAILWGVGGTSQVCFVLLLLLLPPWAVCRYAVGPVQPGHAGHRCACALGSSSSCDHGGGEGAL